MNEKLIEAQDVFLDKINQICRKFGLNNIMAQLYAVLYLSNNPLSLNDMVERLKISKGSVSINMRVLERYGAVRKIWVKGSRKDYYEAEIDIAKVIMDRVTSMARNRLFEVNDMVDASRKTLNTIIPVNAEDEKAVRVFKERLDKLQALHSKAYSLFQLIDSGLFRTMIKDKIQNGSEYNHSNKIEAVL